MLRFCFMGEGESLNKDAFGITERKADGCPLTPLSPGGRGAGGEGVELKLTRMARLAPLQR